ncbi:MAG: hypothetical protein BJ554DRAFT_1257, partial [Olpidium bornovanus]
MQPRLPRRPPDGYRRGGERRRRRRFRRHGGEHVVADAELGGAVPRRRKVRRAKVAAERGWEPTDHRFRPADGVHDRPDAVRGLRAAAVVRLRRAPLPLRGRRRPPPSLVDVQGIYPPDHRCESGAVSAGGFNRRGLP